MQTWMAKKKQQQQQWQQLKPTQNRRKQKKNRRKAILRNVDFLHLFTDKKPFFNCLRPQKYFISLFAYFFFTSTIIAWIIYACKNNAKIKWTERVFDFAIQKVKLKFRKSWIMHCWLYNI